MSFHIGDEVFVRTYRPDFKIQNERGKIIQMGRTLTNTTMFKIQFECINYTTWVLEKNLRQRIVLCV